MTRKEQIISEIKVGIENGTIKYNDAKEVLAKLETVFEGYFDGDNSGWDADMFVFMNSKTADEW